MSRLQDAVPGDPQRAWQRRPNSVFINPLHLAPESTEHDSEDCAGKSAADSLLHRGEGSWAAEVILGIHEQSILRSSPGRPPITLPIIPAQSISTSSIRILWVQRTSRSSAGRYSSDTALCRTR